MTSYLVVTIVVFVAIGIGAWLMFNAWMTASNERQIAHDQEDDPATTCPKG